MSLCTPNAYTTICTSTIYTMVSGLETLKLPVYQDIIVDPSVPDATASLFTIYPLKYASASYMIVQSDISGNLFFWSVNMNSTNVLTAQYNTFNVIPALIVNYRGIVTLKYKDKTFKFFYSVPFLDQLVNTKAKIQNLFNEDIKAYVLYDKIVFCYVRVAGDSYYRFIYAGLLAEQLGDDGVASSMMVENKTDFDYSNGTLVGLIDKKPFMLYNKYGLQTLNLYPFTNYLFSATSLQQNLLVIGGINNYFLFPENGKPALWRVNYAFELQYQAPYLQTDNLWGYTPLISLITIPNSCQFEPPNTGPTYIMAFNSAMMPTYAFLGTTNFNNTDNTLITFKSDIIYSFDPTLSWIVYPANGPLPPPSPQSECITNDYLYYLYDSTLLTIYQPTFANFIAAYNAAISIQDLMFSTERNQQYIRVTPGLYSQIMKNGEDRYRDMNFYFLTSPMVEEHHKHPLNHTTISAGIIKKCYQHQQQQQ